MDIDNKLRPLGTRFTIVLDNIDNVLSADGCSQTATTRGHCLATPSYRTLSTFRLFVRFLSALFDARDNLLTPNRIISLGKLAKKLFPATHAIPHVEHAGDVFYTVGLLLGLLLWGFSIVWFVVAVVMISTVGKFPFNMGWWGFIFPIGKSFALWRWYS